VALARASRDFEPAEVAEMKQAARRELAISGANLVAQAPKLDINRFNSGLALKAELPRHRAGILRRSARAARLVAKIGLRVADVVERERPQASRERGEVDPSHTSGSLAHTMTSTAPPGVAKAYRSDGSRARAGGVRCPILSARNVPGGALCRRLRGAYRGPGVLAEVAAPDAALS
jgi:hypothetical protein